MIPSSEILLSLFVGGTLGWVTGKAWIWLQVHNKKKDGK